VGRVGDDMIEEVGLELGAGMTVFYAFSMDLWR
jgi:hypothetical protein